MMKCWRHPLSASGAVVLLDDQVAAYVDGGRRQPPGAHYLEVPRGALVRTGFWLAFNRATHRAARLYLVATRLPILPQGQEAPALLAYLSRAANTCYLGHVEQLDGRLCLQPFLHEDHPPLPLDQLTYVGQVVAAS